MAKLKAATRNYRYSFPSWLPTWLMNALNMAYRRAFPDKIQYYVSED